MAPISPSGANVSDAYSVGVFKMMLKNQISSLAGLYKPLVDETQNVNPTAETGAASKDPPHLGNNVNIAV